MKLPPATFHSIALYKKIVPKHSDKQDLYTYLLRGGYRTDQQQQEHVVFPMRRESRPVMARTMRRAATRPDIYLQSFLKSHCRFFLCKPGGGV